MGAGHRGGGRGVHKADRSSAAPACLPSYKLWYRYLKARRAQVKHRCVTDPAYEDVNNCHERAFVFMHKVGRAEAGRGGAGELVGGLRPRQWAEWGESESCPLGRLAVELDLAVEEGVLGSPCASVPLRQMPRLWLDYCQFLMDQGRVTHTRRTFDRALRALPITQHSRIWPLYLRFLRSHPLPETAVRGYRRFLKVGGRSTAPHAEAPRTGSLVVSPWHDVTGPEVGRRLPETDLVGSLFFTPLLAPATHPVLRQVPGQVTGTVSARGGVWSHWADRCPRADHVNQEHGHPERAGNARPMAMGVCRGRNRVRMVCGFLKLLANIIYHITLNTAVSGRIGRVVVKSKAWRVQAVPLLLKPDQWGPDRFQSRLGFSSADAALVGPGLDRGG